MRKHTMTAIKPAVRPPSKCVQRLMRIRIRPAIEQDLRGPGGFRFIPVLDGNENKIRRSADPYSAKPNLQSAHQVQSFHENRSMIEPAVAIGIFEDKNAVLSLAFRRADRIGVGFCHPKPASIINSERNWLFHIRFARE